MRPNSDSTYSEMLSAMSSAYTVLLYLNTCMISSSRISYLRRVSPPPHSPSMAMRSAVQRASANLTLYSKYSHGLLMAFVRNACECSNAMDNRMLSVMMVVKQ
ncbi:TPA: hypothetical protein N0F65_011042 [Lagenidium giganteum]|uniref:Uncharacterized protein n=1 Tax=Lagenidium giganteum TaxID=4803 RepID=A0AAV2ZF53_9STRA|nr:TPA: hypothetical protein N0F65_011042 [Lagenidium giganteum]